MEFLRVVAAIIWGLDWWNVAGVAALAYIVFLLFKLHTGKSPFRIDDLFLSNRGRADLYKVIVASMAVLSAYVVVRLVQNDKPVETILLGVLAIFVTGRAFTAAFGKEGLAGDVKHEEEVKPEEGKQ